ncbi:efflux RND transporter permease subunit [Azotosporobacter soli]|uniref:efflux RND transporter permease subunit n=1 Tax=Azotosporobacter soli TaxID=3055040 RepID=UPI0031FEFE0F
MKQFNFTQWALARKQLIWFFVILMFVMGVFSYRNLGRMEDPDFTIKQMLVVAVWPGATARQVEEQVTDKLEKKLQDTPGLDYLKSYSMAGQTVIYVNLKDTVPESAVRPTWLEVRNMVSDVRSSLPDGVQEPIFNDRFDDVFGNIYALSGDGYSYEELRESAEKIRRILLGVPSVKKVTLVGVQTEKIYIEVENAKLAQLGIDPSLIISSLQGQNAVAAAGMLQTSSDNVNLRISGMFEQLDDVRSMPIRANDRTFRLGDIAKVTRSYSDPSDPKMFFNGKPAIGLALSMEKGGNVLTLGKNLQETVDRLKHELPLGMEIGQVANQPKVVETSINEFVKSLMEAVLIVLIVSFISLGARSGMIVALCIPLVIAGVFTCMYLLGIDLQKISLGALIIALGLLVDDAIITIETMVVKMEQGYDRFNAACYAYTATAYPRLAGALITCAGFIPVGFSKGTASEYVGSIFSVVTIALLLSWVVACTATPLFGYLFIRIKPGEEMQDEHAIYDTPFYRRFTSILTWCLNQRKKVLLLTLAAFIAAVGLMGLVKMEFFPSSTRPELIVGLTLPVGSSLKATEDVAAKFAAAIDGDPLLASYSYHTGEGAPRFVLCAEPVFNEPYYSEFVIVAKDAKARDAFTAKMEKMFAEDETFAGVRMHSKVLPNGPPSAYPVMLRASGYDPDQVREIAKQVRDAMQKNSKMRGVSYDWDEKSKVMRLEIDQDKARMLGVDKKSLATSLQTQLSGVGIGEFRENDKTVGIVFRMDSLDRNNLAQVKNCNVHIGNGRYVPLDQIAKISYDAEEGLIWRRDLKPTIIIQGEIEPGVTGNDVAQQIYDDLAQLRQSLPPGYSIELDGPLEQSIKSSKLMLGPVPAMIIIILVLLMLQLQNMGKMLLTLLTAPLGIIGVSLGLLITGKAMGFVVQLGILALAGIIMRNSIILMDQIEQLMVAGECMWDAIIKATVIRFRPIMLTAAAAILGMIPLISSVFWGPMAVAIAAGLFGATVLTLLVLPTMYAAWYKVYPPSCHQEDVPASVKE